MTNTTLSFKAVGIVLGSLTGIAVFPSISRATLTSALNPCPGIYYEEPHNSLRTVPEGCPPNAKGRSLAASGQGLTGSGQYEKGQMPNNGPSQSGPAQLPNNGLGQSGGLDQSGPAQLPNNGLGQSGPAQLPNNSLGQSGQGQLPNNQDPISVPDSTNQGTPNQQTPLPDEQQATTEPNQAPLPEEQQTVIATLTPRMGLVDVRLKNETTTSITYQAIGYTQQRSLAGKEEVVLQNVPVPVSVTFVRPDGGLVKVTPTVGAEPGVLSLSMDGANGLTDSQTTVRIQSTGKVSAY